jgi:hypothetical protein
MSRIGAARHRFRRHLSDRQRFGVRILAWASVISLFGVSVTGVWQFFAHESNPAWYSYEAGRTSSGARAAPTAMAEWHAIFGAAVGAVALFGGAFLAYKVIFDVPWQAVVAFAVVLFGLVSGSVMRFNLVKLDGRDYDEAARGYGQLFGGDLEFIVTSRYELGAMAARIWTASHVLTVPIILALIWVGLPRSADD